MSIKRSPRLRAALTAIAMVAVVLVALVPSGICVRQLFGNATCCKPAASVKKACCAACAKKECGRNSDSSAPLSSSDHSSACFSTPESHVLLVQHDLHVAPPVVIALAADLQPSIDVYSGMSSAHDATSAHADCAQPQRLNCVYRI